MWSLVWESHFLLHLFFEFVFFFSLSFFCGSCAKSFLPFFVIFTQSLFCFSAKHKRFNFTQFPFSFRRSQHIPICIHFLLHTPHMFVSVSRAATHHFTTRSHVYRCVVSHAPPHLVSSRTHSIHKQSWWRNSQNGNWERFDTWCCVLQNLLCT